MKEVKILEVEKEVLKRIDMICRFACLIEYLQQANLHIISILFKTSFSTSNIFTSFIKLLTFLIITKKLDGTSS